MREKRRDPCGTPEANLRRFRKMTVEFHDKVTISEVASSCVQAMTLARLALRIRTTRFIESRASRKSLYTELTW